MSLNTLNVDDSNNSTSSSANNSMKMPTTTNKCKTASHSIDAILGLRAAAAAAVVASQHLPQRSTQPPFLHSTHTGMKNN